MTTVYQHPDFFNRPLNLFRSSLNWYLYIGISIFILNNIYLLPDERGKDYDCINLLDICTILSNTVNKGRERIDTYLENRSTTVSWI